MLHRKLHARDVKLPENAPAGKMRNVKEYGTHRKFSACDTVCFSVRARLLRASLEDLSSIQYARFRFFDRVHIFIWRAPAHTHTHTVVCINTISLYRFKAGIARKKLPDKWRVATARAGYDCSIDRAISHIVDYSPRLGSANSTRLACEK